MELVLRDLDPRDSDLTLVMIYEAGSLWARLRNPTRASNLNISGYMLPFLLRSLIGFALCLVKAT